MRKSRIVGLVLGGLITIGIIGLQPTTATASTIPTIQTVQAVQAVQTSTALTLTRAQKIEIVVGYALRQRGDDYRYGAAGPYAYDCSGLVMMSYRQIGKYLPHYSGAMLRYGWRVSYSNLRRGDVIWPHWGHVQIYLGYYSGARWVVEASSSRDEVVVRKMWRFWTARRMI